MITSSIDGLNDFRRGLSTFLSRPYGGVEVEIIITLSEIAQAVFLLVVPNTMWNTRAFQDLVYLGIPAWLVAIPWAAAGLLSAYGLVPFFISLYRSLRDGLPINHKIGAFQRWLGSLFSVVLWAWVAVKTGLVLDWSIVYVFICILFSAWSIRITLASLRRWQTPIP